MISFVSGVSMAVEQVLCHPILRCAHTLERELNAVAGMPADYLRTSDKAEALVAFARVEAELAELKLRILATASDVAEEHAARDVGTWLAHATRVTFETARADLRLAEALERHAVTAAALRTGEVNADQARVIVRAVDKLPADLDDETRTRAEEHLVRLAHDYGPKELAILGAKILEVVAPEVAEAELGKALEREDQRARDNCSVRIKRIGDGISRITALVPDSIAERLTIYLDAEDSPRSRDGRCATSSTSGVSTRVSTSSTTGVSTRVSTSSTTGGRRSRGEAFCRLLEILDPHRLPDHGGDATTVMVTISLESLSSQLGAAMLGGGGLISATEARRLACTAKIIPAVLGGKGEILDLGRGRRLYTPPQRKAMRLRDKRCRAEGCSIPAAWTEAHHLKPWSMGGKTDLADGVLLCSHHHHRAHESRYLMTKLPSGDYRFHRRT